MIRQPGDLPERYDRPSSERGVLSIMTRKIIHSHSAAAALVMAFLVAISLASIGCNSEKTYVDGAGRTLTLKGVPERIVSVNPAHTETLFELGLGDKVVGVDSFSYRPPEAAEKEQVGDSYNLNLEKIAALKPDLVIIAGSKDSPPAQLADIDRLGIPSYVSAPGTVEEVLADIRSLATVVGANKEGEELVERLRADLDAVSAALPAAEERPAVFIAVDPDLWTVGPSSFVSDVIAAAGGVNVVDDEAQYLQISMEQLIVDDPDVILVAIPEDWATPLLTRPGWETLTAVKEGRVYFVDSDLVSRPGPAVIEGIKEVAGYLVPAK